MNQKTNLKYLLEGLTSKALLHYNISTLEQFKAGIEAVRATRLPLIFGFSTGEIQYLGIETIVSLRTQIIKEGLPIYFNGDHLKDFDLAKKLIILGFDSVMFDNSALDLQVNILRTKKIVAYRNKVKSKTLIEGEIGFIGGGSDIKDIVLKEEYFTDPSIAQEYLQKTNVDLLAIAIGNIHGIPLNIKFKGRVYQKAKLDFKRLAEIKNRVAVPLVLHGGSGLTKEDYLKAIKGGIKIIHLNTDFRKIWKEKLKLQLKQDSFVPYKILSPIISALKDKIVFYQKLFWYLK